MTYNVASQARDWRLTSSEAEDTEKGKPAGVSAACRFTNGREDGILAAPLFCQLRSGTRTRHILIWITLLACICITVASSGRALWPVIVGPAALSARAITAYVSAVTVTPLLEVFQVYPPVLTVTPGGALELTDGSSNATVDLINNNNQSCLETLVVHSFAYSYGQPYVGMRTPSGTCLRRHI